MLSSVNTAILEQAYQQAKDLKLVNDQDRGEGVSGECLKSSISRCDSLTFGNRDKLYAV